MAPLLGLGWQDLDLDRGILRVRQTVGDAAWTDPVQGDEEAEEPP
jgi:hypothetical protein